VSSHRSGRHLSRLSRHDPARPATGAVLVLHGGRVSSREPVTAHQLAVLRMSLLAAALQRRLGRHRVVVWNLRFGVRGWNGPEASPVADVLWALEEMRRSRGLPVVLVGHSMGGRAAVRAAAHPDVRGVVGLAPWLPAGEPVGQLAGRSLTVLHGTADRITDPAASARYVETASGSALRARYRSIRGDGHAMLRRAPVWNRLSAEAVLEALR
jgi:pimeloyl-ACP methyl ester carboxylesterase